MIRRILTALLAASIAMPIPSFATGRCSMSGLAVVERCSCCDSAEGVAQPKCRASVENACNCEVRADTTGDNRRAPVVPHIVSPDATFVAVLLPASVSTPQRRANPIHLAAPPGTGAVFRPLICTWNL